MRRGRLFAAASMSLLAVTGASTIGATLSYTCVVKRVYDLSDTGELETSVWEKQMRGSAFSVSRVNGEIIGEVVPTLTAVRTRVVNPGTSKNSFKATAEFISDNAGSQIQLIEIQEFMEGESKPFVAASMGGAGIVTGVCR